MRPTIPFSMSQTSQVRACRDIRQVDEWIASLLEIREENPPYYLHIDHLQIIPSLSAASSYEVFAVYHRVYLERGE